MALPVAGCPYVKARRDHRIVLVAVIVGIAVNTDRRRKVLGVATGNSEAETEFLRSLTRRGLRGVKLVISAANPEGFREDAQEGLKAAPCSWSRTTSGPSSAAT